MIYIHPRHDFDEDEKKVVRVHIDNSFDLGWKKEDILLVTNFPYEYRGIKALIVGDENYCVTIPATSKVNTLVNVFTVTTIGDLIRKRLITDEIYWYHDLDVFQNEVITEEEIKLELGTADLGLTDKGRMPKWNGGTLFFRKSAADIFQATKDIAVKYNTGDEESLMVLSTNNLLWATRPDVETSDDFVPANIPGMENAPERIKKVNITYNLRPWNIRSTYAMATKPIRVVHFYPPFKDELDFFMHGKNKLNMVLVPERLIKIFNKHGIK
jgi:hypothetical protein